MSSEYFFGIIWYSVLLAIALVLVKQNLEEFIDSKTSYFVEKQPLSPADLPTVIVCWLRTKEKENFTVHLKFLEKEEQGITLNENKTVNTIFGLGFHLSEMIQTFQPQRQCHKISPTQIRNRPMDLQKFGLEIIFNFRNVPDQSRIQWTYIRLTSEANAYGITGGRWYDGLSKEIKLQDFPSNTANVAAASP